MRAPVLRRQGFTLVEALVALLVMAFGILGVLGMQATLRLGADSARQRSEAVRIAQETIEAARAYADLGTYAGLESSAPTPVTGYATANAIYAVQRRVADAGDDLHGPRRKTLAVDVAWADRSGRLQSLRLSTALHGVPPELAGTLVVPPAAAALRTPQRRHASIPREASFGPGDGASRFAPPGLAGVTWVFDNASGFITQVCQFDTCAAVDARLLSGYVRFASVRTGAPSGADAEQPPGPADPAELQLDVVVQQTEPMAQGVECAERSANAHVAYFCAVPVGALRAWSGRSLIRTPDPSTLAATVDERSSAKRRVCRYTTHLGHATVPAQMDNEGHPLQYVGVSGTLPNQNFLVVRAGDDTQAFDCPNDDDGSGSAQLPGRTHRHQPAA